MSEIVSQLPDTPEIQGVRFKLLQSHPDDRGFFREVIRHTDSFFDRNSFGQWSHSKMTKDVVKAWHYHHIQTDWWYLPLGTIETVLFDNREESPTYGHKQVFHMGSALDACSENAIVCCVEIPPGVLHGLKVLSEEAHLFYITSEVYNPEDEGRFAFNSEVVGHEWGEGVVTSEKDRQNFVPTAPRPRL